MNGYLFDSGSAVAHFGHNWEEWHAYLAADLPEDVSLDASGICCHTCQVIVVDDAGIKVDFTVFTDHDFS